MIRVVSFVEQDMTEEFIEEFSCALCIIDFDTADQLTCLLSTRMLRIR